jgi:DNA-binding NarL/FixJ family response regulator
MVDTDRVRGPDGGRAALRILIVEDDVLIAMDAEMTLLDAGHEVVGIAADEEAAIALALRTSPDVLLLDLRLARGGCGRRVAERLAGKVRAAIVFASGNLTPDTRTRLMALSPAAMLPKPYRPEQLVRAMSQTF